jgi:hypothetical protein
LPFFSWHVSGFPLAAVFVVVGDEIGPTYLALLGRSGRKNPEDAEVSHAT